MKHLSELASRLAALDDAQRIALAAVAPVVNVEGHALSVRNQCLLAMQSGTPVTMVGGFRQWLATGRCVRKGESALWILCPMSRKAKADEKADAEGSVTFFREVAVFDVSQTAALDGITSAEQQTAPVAAPPPTNPAPPPRARAVPQSEYYSDEFTQTA